MELSPLHNVRSKQVEVIILGAPLTQERAAEVLRRTDLLFQYLSYEPLGAYGRAVRARLGFPCQKERVPGQAHTAAEAGAILEIKESIARWRGDWGALELEWLFNHQVLAGRGWVHGDGTIAMADELEDYPTGVELMEDCQRLAETFPDLSMDVAVWGGGETILGFPLIDAPKSPWPSELSGAVRSPTTGFLIGSGAVEVVDGANPRLFQRFEARPETAIERALSEARRCRGDAHGGHGVSDAVIETWRETSLALGLTRA